MRRKTHADTAIVATMEYPNDSYKTCGLTNNLFKIKRVRQQPNSSEFLKIIF